MNNKIDLKSSVVGICVGVLLTLALGAADSDPNPGRRFQCSASDSFLLIVDTVTGQAWALAPRGVSITGSPAGFFDKKMN